MEEANGDLDEEYKIENEDLQEDYHLLATKLFQR